MAAAAIPVFERGGQPNPGWHSLMNGHVGVRPRTLQPLGGNPRALILQSEAQNRMPEKGQGSQEPRLAQAPGLPPATRPGVTTAEAEAQAREQKALNGLALRCAQGDAAAWNDLARTQHRRVYGICYRFTGAASEAEDCTQEVFLKMYRVIGSFDPARGGFGTWLTTLTRNLLVDTYRRGRNDRVTDSLDEPLGDEESGGATKADRLQGSGRSQEQHVSGLELRAQIQMALKQVSPELREAVILRDLEDMDYKDIAEVLGIPQGTVKSRISRGRAELARLLKSIEGQVM